MSDDVAVLSADLDVLGAEPEDSRPPRFAGARACRPPRCLVDHCEYCRSQVISRPPGRNEPRWCSSERKYKNCCAAPASDGVR